VNLNKVEVDEVARHEYILGKSILDSGHSKSKAGHA
jgi:hypothetical protein